MSDSCQHSNPLKHQGTSQAGRFLQALDPAHVELHGLEVEDWLEFARDYARLINYYPADNPDVPNGDWQDFFGAKDEIESLLEQYGEGDTEPHLALFISFLKLLAYPRESLNQLPKKHLDFYYKEVLKIEKQPFTPDRVHVLFELAKNADQELIQEGVLLKAGKDTGGNPLNYKTINSLVVNPAKVVSLRSVYVDEEGILRKAPVSNSADGKGDDFEKDVSWPAFGSANWPEAELSFYVASPLLHLKEGKRTITLDFTLDDPSKLKDIARSDIEAQLTGKKGWTAPLEVKFAKIDDSDDLDHTTWLITLEIDKDPVVAYDESVHEAGLPVDQPVIKMRFRNVENYEILKAADIVSLELKTDVEEVISLQLQNDLGNLDPTKPFMPFGSQPKVGSKLSIAYSEMYGKPIKKFNLSMRWLNLPANFSEYYKQYQTAINAQKKKQSYSFINVNQYAYNALVFYNTEWLIGGNIPQLEIFDGLDGPPEDTMRQNFKVKVSSPYTSESGTHELFTNPPQAKITVGESPKKVGRGEIEMVLTESFYHDLYPELYVDAVVHPGDSVDLPNEPYTPLLDQLTLGYTAVDTVVLEKIDDAEPHSLMFHHHPFGTKQVDAESKNKTLLPDYPDKEMYVGLEKMKAGSNISLLFQVVEGSENPLNSTFAENESIQWSVLAGNDWIPVEDRDFARNETNNFLRSGMVELLISKDATTDHTMLDSGLHWLRISLPKPKQADAVCRFINVHAQASKAIFDNQGNTTDHLNEGLPPETIGKLVNPRAKLKSVAQPYASFGGKPAESDPAFYRRISERLRHKNRALSIWDYEHIILQQFPSLYKVKCLNHTRWNSDDSPQLDELSPGNVTLVLIPKITEKSNAEFRLKPMVSRDFKDRVEAFINRLHSPHAVVKTADAIYEPVRFEFDIQFRKGLDFNFYEKQTLDDLTRLMAPWVFEVEAAIRFGGTFTEYQIVHFLENLEYVDYVDKFNMYHTPYNTTESKVREAKPSNPMAILVPAKKHDINPAKSCT